MPKVSYTDLFKRLNPRFKNDPIWNPILKAVSRVIDDATGELLQDLRTSADPKRYHRGDGYVVDDGKGLKMATINRVAQRADGVDILYIQLPNRPTVYEVEVVNHKDKGVLINGARSKGLNYFSDLLSAADYVRVNEWINQYWPHSSADNFVRFMGFIKNLDLSLEQLWSQESVEDLYPFLEPYNSGMISVASGGTHYPTSHVELQYNAVVSANPGNDLAYLFYMLAPIHLVLQRIAANVDAEIQYSLRGVADILFINSAVVDISDTENTYI